MNVYDRQCLLAFLKRSDGTAYYIGKVDGINGPLTRNAIAAFQKDYGNRTATGETDMALDDALRYAVTYGVAGKQETEEPSVTFWDEIAYFDREEFRCKCGGRYCSGFPSEPDEVLVRLVNDLRKSAGKPAVVTSGLRCGTWNTLQKGVADSRHKYGKAVDFYINGLSGKQLLAMAQADPRTRYAYIIDGPYVHIDVE